MLLLLSLLGSASAFSLGALSGVGSSRTSNLKMGVTVKTTKPGDGKTYPKAGQMVSAHYTGKLKDGTVVDTSRGFLKQPFKFQIGAGEVIKGWDQGMLKMCKGEKATLACTADFGYGKRGAPPDIPPNAMLIFDVELVSISGKSYF